MTQERRTSRQAGRQAGLCNVPLTSYASEMSLNLASAAARLSGFLSCTEETQQRIVCVEGGGGTGNACTGAGQSASC